MITLALIGKGRWGSKYLETVKRIKDCQIKYIKTRDYLDLLSYLDLIDGIIIATPAETHSQIIQAFPDKYLLVEKPLTTSYKDALAITNPNIMVGHIYAYNQTLQELLDGITDIRYLSFKLANTESYSGKSLLWELAPHGVALAVDLLGEPKKIDAWRDRGNLFIELKYEEATCRIEVGWNYSVKKREIYVVGSKTIYFDSSIKQEVSPLENQIRAFLGFIESQGSKTGLKQAQMVIKVLDYIKQTLDNKSP